MGQGGSAGCGSVFCAIRPDSRRLSLARPDGIVMHPQPMNRGIEIASDVPTTPIGDP